MTRPRASLVSLSDTPWYHVVTRCVRRAYLCGFDRLTGRSFEHRRGWVELRLRQLAGVFAIDVAAYAVMSNHVHLVVRLDAERASQWSDEEVLRRWRCLFRGPVVVERFLSPATRTEMTEAELDLVARLVATYRARLADLSWFMRVLNESIARAANREDGVRGRFWEGRFRSQAILDETALLAVMAYVDLNPIRAGIAETPEASAHTGIAARIADLQGDGDDAKAVPQTRQGSSHLPSSPAAASTEPTTDVHEKRDTHLPLTLPRPSPTLLPTHPAEMPHDPSPRLARLLVRYALVSRRHAVRAPGVSLRLRSVDGAEFRASARVGGVAVAPARRSVRNRCRGLRGDEQSRERKGHPLTVDAPKALSYASPNTPGGDAP
ncbi:hypothetical protein McPS_21250 [Marichromatium sp. PS1]|uniref:transposase n=1 Tax=Marichromatium sp. PS1 TaxID=3138932 RepID=UPI0032E5336B